MPNHISNKLTLHCDSATAAKVFAEIGSPADEDGEMLIDFNKLIAYPERYAKADRERREWEKANPCVSWANAPKDGYNQGGYEWCKMHWGTKWTAYSQKRLSETAIYFETAWSPPIRVLEALHAKYPDVKFILKYADEDIGSNAGFYYSGGIHTKLTDRGEAAKLWFQLNPDAEPKEYGYDPATFEYVGEEDGEAA